MAPDGGATRLDAPPRAELGNSGAPALRLGSYEGPLDLLLELARAQRVDLTAISVVALAEAFGASVERAIAGRRVPLSQMADWLVMAAWLLLLRSRLLLPAGSEEDRAAQAEAAQLRPPVQPVGHRPHRLAVGQPPPQLGRLRLRRPVFLGARRQQQPRAQQQ
jgi:segregation and condensation protein A